MQLIAKPQTIQYDSRTGQFRGNNGRFVSRSTVVSIIEEESARTEVRLMGITRRLTNGSLTLSEWETEFAQELKRSHLRLMMLAAGGKDNVGASHYGMAGAQIKKQYQYLDGFAIALKEGKLSRKQAIARAKLYGTSVRSTFYNVERLQRQLEGFTVAKRSLDPQAHHCAECLIHSTRGEWRKIENVTPPGVACSCGQRCRCSIIYAKLADVIKERKQ